MNGKMNAVIFTKYGSPEVLRLQAIKKPTPAADELLIKIRATSVTAVDAIFRGGQNMSARLYTGLFKPKNPILGGELAGVVEAVGAEVTQFQVGDAVLGLAEKFATYADYICLPEGAVLLKPAGISFEEAAVLPGGALTAVPFIREWGNLQAGQHILINGASGSIGTYAVQIAKLLGGEVTAVCSGKNASLVKSLGADHIIDYTKEDFTQSNAAYDIIFDTVAKSNFNRAKKVLAPNGIFLALEAKISLLLQMAWTKRFSNKKLYVGFAGLRSMPEKMSDIRFVLEQIEASNMKPIIDRSYPIAKIRDAHRYVDTGRKRGNVAITLA